MERYDVAVVGAGPAGSTCAYELGRAGKKVALFDHSHPREKPCGGAIPLPLLEEFGLPEKVIEARNSIILLKSPSGDSVELCRRDSGAVVMRRKFDGFLVKRASGVSDFFDEKVVEFEKQNTGWLVKTGKRRVYADYLVGADGCPSMVRKKLAGPIDPKNLAHCVGYHLKHDNNHISKHFKQALELHFSNVSGRVGYVWVFPKRDCVNIGLGDRLGSGGLRKRIDGFVSNEKRLAPSEKTLYAHLIPVVRDPAFFDLPASGKNWALIGDAAGHVNPITGEGISFGMIGGRLAARAIIGGDLQEYEKGWRERIGSFFYLGARYQTLFYNSRLLNFTIKQAKKSAELRDFLFDVIGSVRPYSELLAPRAAGRLLKITSQLLFV